jgi:phage baseplate assembly protein W
MGNTILSDYNGSGTGTFLPSPVAQEVYTDLATSFVHPVSGDALLSRDIDAVKNSIRNIVLTAKGERPFNPEFGSGVGSLLFELADGATAAALESEITAAIIRWEPRVTDIFTRVDDEHERNAYRVQVAFTMSGQLSVTIEFLLNRIR